MTEYLPPDALVGEIVSAANDEGDVVLTYVDGRVLRIIALGIYDFEDFGIIQLPADQKGPS